MKKQAVYLFSCILLIISAHAQQTTIINISTGISDGTGQEIPSPILDDTYKVGMVYSYGWLGQGISPFPLSYVNANAVWSPQGTNGFQDINNACNALYTLSGFLPDSPGSTAISPYLDASGWARKPTVQDLPLPNNGVRGWSDRILSTWWKAVFNFGCAQGQNCSSPVQSIQSVKLNIAYFFVNGMTIQEISLNGFQIPLSNISSFPQSLLIPTAYLNIGGPNEIIFKVPELSCQFPQYNSVGHVPIVFDLKGQIEIAYTNDLKDLDGNVKNIFCIGEDVYMDGKSFVANDYTVNIEYNSGNGYSPLLTPRIINGAPYWVNITDMVESAIPNYFLNNTNTNTTYRVTLEVKNGCGEIIKTTKEFEYICCGPTDASFELKVSSNNTHLEGKSSVKGSHTWEVYTAASSNAGPYNLLNVFNTQKFSLNAEGVCYYVRHSVANLCGNDCVIESFCNFNCDDKVCNLTAPTGLSANSKGSFSWTGQTGASSYIIEFRFMDPACCPYPPVSVPLTITKQISVPSNSYLFSTFDFPYLLPDEIKCYSWRVYAICPDGTMSQPSLPQCFNTGSKAASEESVTGIAQVGEQQPMVNIFPNPASGLVSIEINTATDVGFSVIVFDATGKRVQICEQQYTKERQGSVKWDTRGLGKGLYVIKFTTSQQEVFSKKIIVE